jgi:hypothetical protein
MDARARKRAFVVAAALILATIVALTAFAPKPKRERARPATAGSRRASVVAPPPPASTTARTAAPAAVARLGAHGRKDAVRAGRRFAQVLLRYESGDLSGPVRARIRGGASSALAAELLDEPPRVPPSSRRPAHGRVVGSELGHDQSTTGVDVVVTISRSRRFSLLTLELEKRAHGWLVTAVR